jgi:hypothetical protein
LNGIDHQEFLKGYKFYGIEALGHDESPGGVEEKHSRALDIGQKN